MKTLLLSAVSAMAIMVAVPAYAMDAKAEAKTEARIEAQKNVAGDDRTLEKGYENTKAAVSDAAEDLSDATENAYEDMKAVFIDNDETTEMSTVEINTRQTATGMIGANVYNGEGESIAKISDIILDQSGNASMVVVADGEIFGLGKKVAFDYSIITTQTDDGDVIAPLTEKVIDQAAAFSYDMKDKSDDIRVMPANGYSVAALLDSQLIGEKNEVVAEIDNITLVNGKAENLIVGFNEILGMGGEKAALPFSDAKLVKDAKDETAYDFKLGASQAAQFEAYKARF